jgi:hypothetical protein
MQRSVLIMKRKMMRKKKEKGGDGVVLPASKEVDPNNESVWYLDTGISNHMCGYKHIFTEIEEIMDGHVSFGDASKKYNFNAFILIFQRYSCHKGSTT